MKPATLALMGLLVTGGALADPAPDAAPPAAGLTIIDKRPAKDDTTELLSLWATSCKLGIQRLGDEFTTPPKLELLRQDLATQLGSALATTITVSHYSIFNNSHAAAVGGNPFGHGLVGAALDPDCTREKTGEGGLDPGEMSTDHQTLVVEINVTIGASAFTGRTVMDTDISHRLEPGDPSVLAALHKANADLAAQIRAAGASPTAKQDEPKSKPGTP